MVDIDDPRRVLAHEIGRQNPHVFGQDEKLRLYSVQNTPHGRFMGHPVQPFGGDMMEGHLELADQVAHQGMIANYGLDPGVDAPELMADQQISQAVVLAGGQDHDPFGPGLRQADLRTGWQTGQGLRYELWTGSGDFRTLELGAHVETPRGGIYELLVSDHVATMAEQHATDGVHQAPLIGAFDQEDRHS
jgi:hypothetical protein